MRKAERNVIWRANPVAAVAVLATALWFALCPAPAPAQTTGRNPSHEDILRGFDASVLWASREDIGYGGVYNPVGMIVKWQKPIVYKVEGLSFKPEMIAFAIATLKRQAGIAGVTMREAAADESANFLIIFRDVANFSLNGRKASCYMTPRFDPGNGHMQSASLYINLSSHDLERCIIHETLHGFGLFNHPHRLHSVLSYYTGNFVHDMTEADEVMLRSLYDAKMKPGMSRLAALSLADGLIEEKRRAINANAPPKTDPTPVLRDVVADLQKAATGGNLRAMVYLAEAARRGYGMAPDMAGMKAQIEALAALDTVEARFELAYALAAGRYLPKDESRAAALYQRNAELDHKTSQNNLAVLLRDGKGVPMDKAAALTWFTIAARDDYALAESNRRKLAETLPATDLDEAQARATAWKSRAQAAR
jgi:hypothetical protein